MVFQPSARARAIYILRKEFCFRYGGSAYFFTYMKLTTNAHLIKLIVRLSLSIHAKPLLAFFIQPFDDFFAQLCNFLATKIPQGKRSFHDLFGVVAAFQLRADTSGDFWQRLTHHNFFFAFDDLRDGNAVPDFETIGE